MIGRMSFAIGAAVVISLLVTATAAMGRGSAEEFRIRVERTKVTGGVQERAIRAEVRAGTAEWDKVTVAVEIPAGFLVSLVESDSQTACEFAVVPGQQLVLCTRSGLGTHERSVVRIGITGSGRVVAKGWAQFGEQYPLLEASDGGRVKGRAEQGRWRLVWTNSSRR